TEKMLSFRGFAKKEAAAQRLWDLLEVPGFEQWFDEWTFPWARRTRRFNSPEATGQGLPQAADAPETRTAPPTGGDPAAQPASGGRPTRKDRAAPPPPAVSGGGTDRAARADDGQGDASPARRLNETQQAMVARIVSD